MTTPAIDLPPPLTPRPRRFVYEGAIRGGGGRGDTRQKCPIIRSGQAIVDGGGDLHRRERDGKVSDDRSVAAQSGSNF
ncbi:Hypothetical protein NTJ_02285 [Nesidiocoris tenuis]|uniref:Uncharacterized protein n=1 Tax=Nesidiocoris tenuis TaxID=355587 RepID=A0ABN7ABS6_9HEMI|nr:Hypothetical protein NTJ_02285 [Nesidiocoris tenuis]